MRAAGQARGEALLVMLERMSLEPAETLAATVSEAVRPLGLTVDPLVVDLPQRLLHPIPAGPGSVVSAPLAVENTLVGRAYQLGEVLAGTDDGGARLLWVPMVDGSERVGVLRVRLDAEVTDDDHLRRWVRAVAGLIGHAIAARLPHSLGLQQLRSGGLSPASDLMWQLLGPRNFAAGPVVISALLEPTDQVAGDAYDYSLDHGVELGVFDGAGHDLAAGLNTTLAVTAIRNARRRGLTDLADQARHADAVLADVGSAGFVTAVLARLDTDTGDLSYLLAGHPAPLLVREGRVVKELAVQPRPPLGISGPTVPMPAEQVGHEQLQPGDRLLLYSDGVVEARDGRGRFFGEQRLIDLTERAELDQLPAPETLRRLVAAVLAHQHGRLQDDATLLLLEWASDRGGGRLLPELSDGPPTVV